MSNLLQIQTQRQDWITAQNTAWTDGFPIIGVAGNGGVIAGSTNVGTGALSVAAVDPGTPIGIHIVQVTGTAGGLAAFSVADPDGDVTGRGVAGLPLYAGGITLALAQGQTPFVVGDTFAVSILPGALDLTGIVFTLDSRMTADSGTFALQATSAPADGTTPTIATGTVGGNIAMRLSRPAMSRLPPGTYPYNVLATDPVADPGGLFPVIAFYGLITHGAVFQTQG